VLVLPAVVVDVGLVVRSPIREVAACDKGPRLDPVRDVAPRVGGLGCGRNVSRRARGCASAVDVVNTIEVIASGIAA
jgi:hypothetical protein